MLLIAIGLIIGLLSSLLGIGGGIILIPALYALFPHFPPQTVIGCSLLVALLNSLINLKNFWRLGLRPSPQILPMMAFAAVGAGIASTLSGDLPEAAIKRIFALVLSLLSVQIFLRSPSGKARSNPLKSSLTGLIGGIISGLTGLGGGAVITPLLLKWIKIPPHKVSLYSNCVIPSSTLVGCLILLSMETPPIADPFFAPLSSGPAQSCRPPTSGPRKFSHLSFRSAGLPKNLSKDPTTPSRSVTRSHRKQSFLGKFLIDEYPPIPYTVLSPL